MNRMRGALVAATIVVAVAAAAASAMDFSAWAAARAGCITSMTLLAQTPYRVAEQAPTRGSARMRAWPPTR